jgi:histone acetyltransferase (RNA polymerase elongator complex component)
MNDIRHREIKFGKNDPKKAVLHDFPYEASDGMEHFLTIEDPQDRTIFSLLRLRLPGTNSNELNPISPLTKKKSEG